MDLGALDGWEGLKQYLPDETVDAMQQQAKQKETQKERLASAAHALFSQPLGAVFLEGLRQHTIEQSCLPNTAVDGMSIALEMARREGENELYRHIVRLIKRGEELHNVQTQPTPV